MTTAEALARATERLRAAGVEDARREARILLEHALGLARERLLARGQSPLDPNQLAAYDSLVVRRASREPLPYLLGHVPFRRLDLLVDARCLIPRPETELLVELALGDLTPWPPSLKGRGDAGGVADLIPLPPSLRRAQGRLVKGRGKKRESARGRPTLSEGEGQGERYLVADVGTGSGAVAISLAVENPAVRVLATDLSADALALARENAARHGVLDRVTFLLGDLLDALPEPVDLIAANLPYVATRDLSAQPELGFEPRLALDGGPDGLDVYRRLLARAPGFLRPGGRILFEIGADQGEAAAALARRCLPGATVRVHRDLEGRDRVVEARYGPPPR